MRSKSGWMKASLYALVYSLWYTLPDKIIPYARSGFEHMTMILTLLSQGFIVEEKTVGGNIMCIFVPQAYDNRDDVGMTVPVTGGIFLETTSMNSTGTQIFKPVEFPSLEERIVILPSFNHPDSQEFDSPRFTYIAEDDRAQPYYSPVYVRPGKVMQQQSAAK